MDIENDIETTEDSFGVMIAKSLILSAAATAGSVAGIIAIGYAIEKSSEIKKRRADKKNQTEEK